jgi:hypothetical protein
LLGWGGLGFPVVFFLLLLLLLLVLALAWLKVAKTRELKGDKLADHDIAAYHGLCVLAIRSDIWLSCR